MLFFCAYTGVTDCMASLSDIAGVRAGQTDLRQVGVSDLMWQQVPVQRFAFVAVLLIAGGGLPWWSIYVCTRTASLEQYIPGNEVLIICTATRNAAMPSCSLLYISQTPSRSTWSSEALVNLPTRASGQIQACRLVYPCSSEISPPDTT